MIRRGQAALEYLVTYGWAILAILVVVGALSYFGLLSPTRYLPAKCDFGAQMECVDFQLWAPDPSASWQNGIVRLQLRNSFGDDINITGFWVEGIEADALHTPPVRYLPYSGSSAGRTPVGQITIPQGNASQEFRVRIRNDGANANPLVLVPGDRQLVAVTVQFRRNMAASPLHNVTGQIYATVLPYGS